VHNDPSAGRLPNKFTHPEYLENDKK